MSLGDLFGSDDNEAQKYLQQALQQYQSINVPTAESETVGKLPQETVQGEITPEQQQAALQGENAFNDVSLDPSSRQAQESALGGFQDIANSGGLDADAKLGIQQAVDAANVQSQGAQGAIQREAQAEGQGGGLNALALRSIAAQGATNNAATAGMQQAAEAEANREAALSQMSSIGGNIENSDYNQAANKAGAQNTINATNAATQNTVNANNVSNNLQAQGANLTNAQNVNASNTAAGQNQAYYNAGLPQQQFNNELSKASGMAGVNQQQAGAAQTAAQNGANFTGQLLKGGLTLGGTMLGGPTGGAIGSLIGGTPSSTNSTIAGTNAYQTNANKVAHNPNLGYADGGMVSTNCYAEGGEVHNHFLCMLGGGSVPGEAAVEGDSPKNDTVPAMLSPGEIVVKRSKAKDPDEAAKEAKRIALGDFVKGYKKGKR